TFVLSHALSQPWNTGAGRGRPVSERAETAGAVGRQGFWRGAGEELGGDEPRQVGGQGDAAGGDRHVDVRGGGQRADDRVAVLGHGADADTAFGDLGVVEAADGAAGAAEEFGGP